MHILPNVLCSEGKQAMKFVQVVEYNTYFFINDAEKKAGRLVPDHVLFFKKALHEITQVVCSLV